MNKLFFTGRIAAAPELRNAGDTKVTRFRLIRNEYAGQGDDGNRQERQVSISFTAFGGIADAIFKNTFVGDQLIVEAEIRNNNYTDKDGNEQYGYNFVVSSFDFGSPGPKKREKLAEAQEKKESETVPV